MTALGSGGGRIGRANELLPVAVGRIIPGPSLDNELLPSQAQMTPVNTIKDPNQIRFTIKKASRDMIYSPFSRASDVAEAV